MRDARGWCLRLAACAPLLLGLVSVGCAPHAAIDRFSHEFHCPADQVRMESLGARSYRVTGCHRTATYVCLTGLDANNGICSLDTAPVVADAPAGTGGNEDEDVAPQRRVAHPLAGRVRIGGVEVPALRMMLSGMPLTFAVEPASDPASFLVFIRTSYAGQAERCTELEMTGGRARVRAPRVADETVKFRVPAEALQAITTGTSLYLAACQRSMWLSAPQRAALAEFARRSRSDAPSGSVAAPPAVYDHDPASRVRAQLDERREVLFACVNQDVLGIRVSWDAAGAVTVSLNGALAGSAEEACVRSQLQELAIPSGAPAGQLVHAFTR